MNDVPAFKVSFGRVAQTLLYEDSQGSILFTFDLSPTEPKGKWNLHLNRQPLTGEGKKMSLTTTAEHERAVKALERTKEHVVSAGYFVEIV
jgi:hypothetical protein